MKPVTAEGEHLFKEALGDDWLALSPLEVKALHQAAVPVWLLAGPHTQLSELWVMSAVQHLESTGQSAPVRRLTLATANPWPHIQGQLRSSSQLFDDPPLWVVSLSHKKLECPRDPLGLIGSPMPWGKLDAPRGLIILIEDASHALAPCIQGIGGQVLIAKPDTAGDIEAVLKPLVGSVGMPDQFWLEALAQHGRMVAAHALRGLSRMIFPGIALSDIALPAAHNTNDSLITPPKEIWGHLERFLPHVDNFVDNLRKAIWAGDVAQIKESALDGHSLKSVSLWHKLEIDWLQIARSHGSAALRYAPAWGQSMWRPALRGLSQPKALLEAGNLIAWQLHDLKHNQLAFGEERRQVLQLEACLNLSQIAHPPPNLSLSGAS